MTGRRRLAGWPAFRKVGPAKGPASRFDNPYLADENRGQAYTLREPNPVNVASTHGDLNRAAVEATLQYDAIKAAGWVLENINRPTLESLTAENRETDQADRIARARKEDLF